MIVPNQMHIIDHITPTGRITAKTNRQRIRPPVAIVLELVTPRLHLERRDIPARRADVHQLPDAVERIVDAAGTVGLAAVDVELGGVSEVEEDAVAKAGD